MFNSGKLTVDTSTVYGVYLPPGMKVNLQVHAMVSGGFFVQPEYSNARNGCVVPDGCVIR